MRLTVLLLWLALPASVIDARAAEFPVPGQEAAESATAFAARLEDYARRLAALRDRALADGSVSYAQVIEAAYPRGVLTPAVIGHKSRRRASLGDVVFTDYERVRVSVPLQTQAYIAGKTPGSRLWGQYNFSRHEMVVDATAHANVIVHEAGHVLQRRELTNRRRLGASVASNTDLSRVEEAEKQGVISASRSARLRYLIRQDEFEVRLQDLNRFFANCVADRPILTHQDALDALYALGVELSGEDLRAACALAKIPDVKERTDPVVVTDPRIEMHFDDASELRELCQWSKRAAGDLWPDVLARILAQAPAHF